MEYQNFRPLGFHQYPPLIGEGEQDIVSWMTPPQDRQSAEILLSYSLSPLVYNQLPAPTSSFGQIDEMNLWRTAEWIRMLGLSKGWAEANHYAAETFRNNSIMGYLLQKLTMQSLKSDLKILKYGHRIEIMEAINQLLSSTVVKGEEVNSFQKLRNRQFNGYNIARIANPVQHANEVRKWVKTGTDSWNKPWNSVVPVNPDISASTAKSEQYKAVPAKGKSKRARPGNHIAYKARQNVAISRGKSFSSAVVGHLLEGSIVLINQIKGRKGRIIQRMENGEIVNIGWVPLFTNEGKQLLTKYWKNGGVVVKNSDAMIKWKTKSLVEDNMDTHGDNDDAMHHLENIEI